MRVCMRAASSSRRVSAKNTKPSKRKAARNTKESKRKAAKKEKTTVKKEKKKMSSKPEKKKTTGDGDIIASGSVDLAGPPKCPFIVKDLMQYWPNTTLDRRLKGLSRLFPGNPNDREISTATPQMQEQMRYTKLIKEHLTFKKGSTLHIRTTIKNQCKKAIADGKFPLEGEEDRVCAMLPRIKKPMYHRPGVSINSIRSQDVVDIVNNGYISGDVLTYFIEYFVNRVKNPKVHVTDPLATSAFFFDRDNSRAQHVDYELLGRPRQAKVLLPNKLFAKGGTLLLPMNYPSNSHWLTAKIESKPRGSEKDLKPPQVIQVQLKHGHEQLRLDNDKIVGTHVVSMLETVLSKRYPRVKRRYNVQSVECSKQDDNGCAVQVLGNVILHLLGLEHRYVVCRLMSPCVASCHRVSPHVTVCRHSYKIDVEFEKKLRDWMFDFVFTHKNED